MIEGVILTPLKIIPGDAGDVLHALKKIEASFHGFGEAYFSTIKKGAIKAWKRHYEMTLNIVVPCGRIKFVLYDDRMGSSTYNEFFEITLSRENYQRLTVPPMIWMGFKGMDNDLNMLLNIANIPHNPAESDRLDIINSNINYKWD